MNHKKVDDKIPISCQKELPGEAVEVDNYEMDTSKVDLKTSGEATEEKQVEIFAKPTPVKKGRTRKKNNKKKTEIEESTGKFSFNYDYIFISPIGGK